MRSPSGGLVDAIVCLLCHDRLHDHPRSPQGPSTEARQAVSLNGITVLAPRRLAHASMSVPAIAANPREGSRLLWFWLKSQTATPKSAQLASRAPACGTQLRIGRRSNGATAPARRSRHSPKSSKLADVEAKRRPVAASSKRISKLRRLGGEIGFGRRVLGWRYLHEYRRVRPFDDRDLGLWSLVSVA